MRQLFKFLLFFLLLAFSITNAMADTQLEKDIFINKKERVLTAPLAAKYAWYLNGEKIPENTRNIKVKATGNYKVEMIDNNGVVSSKSISVAVTSDGQIYKIYLIGDSTVSTYNSVFYPQTGWGQVLQNFFNSNVSIINKAIGGTSSKSYYENHWASVRNTLQSGDFVFIGFGINDRADDPDRQTDPFTTFQEYLTAFINDTKAKGAIPVLVSTVRRNSWVSAIPPVVYNAYHDHPVATRELAATLNIPLIDLDQESKYLMEELGKDYTGSFMYMRLEPGEYPNYPSGRNDDVHFQEMGAIAMARLVAKEISSLSNDPNVKKLIPSLKTKYQVTTSSNLSGAGIITKTASYPQGTHVTLKVIPYAGQTFLGWQNSQGTTVSTNKMYSFVMNSSSTSYKAIFQSGSSSNDSYYSISNRNSNLCLSSNNTNISQYACNSSETAQQFELNDVGDGYFLIKNRKNGNCLRSNGSSIYQTSCDNTYWTEMFSKQDVGSGYYLLKNRNTGTCLRIGNESGNNVYLSSCDSDYWSEMFSFSSVKSTQQDEDVIEYVTEEAFSDNTNSYIIYPTKIDNTLNIDFSNGIRSQSVLNIYSCTGKMMLSENLTNERNNIDVTILSSGLYILKISNGNEVITKKIIKK